MEQTNPTGGHVNVLFVCLGNICRSPMAAGVFRALVAREGLDGHVGVDSAGTGDWHVGKPADPRARTTARQRGVDIEAHRARQVTAGDFHRFDLVLAMDRANHAALRRLQPPDGTARLAMLMEFAETDSSPGADSREVPDPYFGDGDGFETCLDMIESAARGLLDHVRQQAR